MTKKTYPRILTIVLSLAILFAGGQISPLTALAEESSYVWRQEPNAQGELKSYWYEDGVRQGTYGDPQGVIGDGTVRGREIYDPVSDGWYWLDAVYDGAKACDKEVWMPYIYQKESGFDDAEIESNAKASGDMAAQVSKAIRERSGKWVRYDADGKMYKGWYTVEGRDEDIYPAQKGNTYYYDPKTGLMAKGKCFIEGASYEFDENTGVLKGTRPGAGSGTGRPGAAGSGTGQPGANVDASKLPDPMDGSSLENVMAYLNAYDPDGAYIIDNVHQKWWANYENTLAGIETLVHENCHGYTSEYGGWGAEAIYMGNGQHLIVPRTNVFFSTEMVPVVPENLRTFRFKTYVNTSETTMASVQFGPYGLLDEFTAYCWGFNAGVKLYPYYKAQLSGNPKNYLDYVGNIASTALAYEEFRYYILTYLIYAKENHPDVYQGVIENEKFRTAFCATDTKFRAMLKEFEDNINEIMSAVTTAGYTAKISNGYFHIGQGGSSSGRGMFTEDREKLQKELEKPAYQEIYKLLYGEN